MTTMDGDELQRLWTLVEDLTNQLQANRQLCESLQQQADQLRGQAIHSGTGFALRRYNTDLSKEKFESELETLNVHLVKENLSLSHENKQQAILLREYENTLETVMAKFRGFSHSTQQHTLRLTQHYEALLANTTHTAAEQTLAAETAFSGTLAHLGGLVRKALKSLEGEDSVSEADSDETPSKQPTWQLDARWHGSGGYTGKQSDPAALRAEAALEQLTEDERLRIENATLRELLALKQKTDSILAVPASDGEVPTHPDARSGETQRVSPTPTPERRTSLTVNPATIAAEASGQPSLKALEISSPLRLGDERGSSNSPLSPTPRKHQIIQEAILAEDAHVLGRNSQTAADDTDTAASPDRDTDVTRHDQAHAPLADQPARAVDDTNGEAIDAPNLVAEPAPPALTSTGMADAEPMSSNISVTSASGAELKQDPQPTHGVEPRRDALPAGSSVGDLQRVVEKADDQESAAAMPAEPAQADNTTPFGEPERFEHDAGSANQAADEMSNAVVAPLSLATAADRDSQDAQP